MKKCVRCCKLKELSKFINKYNKEIRTCKECSEEKSSWNKEKYIENKDSILNRNKKWVSNNLEQRKKYQSEWQKNNKDKVKEYHHKRRIQRKAGDLTSKQIKELFLSHPYCEYCGVNNELTLEHIIPFFRGGLNTLSNVTVACKKCNSSKHTKLVSEWRNE